VKKALLMFLRRYFQASFNKGQKRKKLLSPLATADLQINGAPSPVPFIPRNPSAGGDQSRE
jgi:hypothetical protein